MATLTYTISSADYAIHKERALRIRAEVYQNFLTEGGLEDTEANQNEFMRLIGYAAIEKAFSDLENIDLQTEALKNKKPTGLS